MQQLQKMKETRETTLLRNVLRNNVHFALIGQEHGALFVNLVFVWKHVFEHLI